MSVSPEETNSRFKQEFGSLPILASAPGRVNLIGEHTDYNQGFVLPCAIGFRTYVAAHPRADRLLRMRSGEADGEFTFDLDGLPNRPQGAWCDYLLGIAWELKKKGIPLVGADVLVHGDVPMGAGLSSSAAVEVATALALLSLSQYTVDLPEIALLCQRAENEFVGARVGVMDPFVSCMGRAGHALLLDCRSLAYELIPLPEHVSIVICNTKVKHQLAGGEYNQRRAECEQAVRILSGIVPSVASLRDVSIQQLQQHGEALPDDIRKRCLHIVQENQRVLDTTKALAAGDLLTVGECMEASHRSLRDLYEVSCRELDAMVECAQGLPGLIGARMTGGGFGGCTVNLVSTAHAAEFAAKITARYHQLMGIHPDVFVSEPSDGAQLHQQR